MSQAPHVVRGARKGFHLGQNVAFEDSLWTALIDSYGNTPMAITAENLAKKYGVSREECDEFALASQERALAAQGRRLLRRRDRAVDVPGPKGTSVTHRKGRRTAPRSDDGEARKVAGAFRARRRRDAGQCERHHRRCGRGRAHDAQAARGRRPYLDRPHRSSGAVVGVDPAIMGIGPAFSIPKALERGGHRGLNDVAVSRSTRHLRRKSSRVLRELGNGQSSAAVPLNPHGGAIALGHPLGASGARLAHHGAARAARARRRIMASRRPASAAGRESRRSLVQSRSPRGDRCRSANLGRLRSCSSRSRCGRSSSRRARLAPPRSFPAPHAVYDRLDGGRFASPEHAAASSFWTSMPPGASRARSSCRSSSVVAAASRRRRRAGRRRRTAFGRARLRAPSTRFAMSRSIRARRARALFGVRGLSDDRRDRSARATFARSGRPQSRDRPAMSNALKNALGRLSTLPDRLALFEKCAGAFSDVLGIHQRSELERLELERIVDRRDARRC